MLYVYLSFIPLAVGGCTAFLKGRSLWLKTVGLVIFGAALLGLFIGPAVLRQG